MRVIPLLAAALFLAGCSVARDEQLTELVAALGAGEDAVVWCEWGDWTDDTQHETCLYFVKASPKRVAAQVIAKLERRGYPLLCRRDGDDVTIAGAQGATSVNADVVADDFVYGNIMPPEEIEVPDDHTALLLRANKPATPAYEWINAPCS
jgi:hypothetical protein